MEPRSSIELKLISCKDLRAFNFFQKLTVYALVFIASDDPTRDLTEEQKQQQKTQTDRESDDDGSNPEWNHEARFDLECFSQRGFADLFFRFEFRHDGVILGDKLLGECRVSIADLLRDVPDVARFVSYEVRAADGKPNGIFNFSYKLNGFGTHSSQILDGRISGYPVLAPDDCSPNTSQVRIQYPTSEIANSYCYPTAALPVASAVYSPAVAPPPPVLFPPSGECHYCYPPPPARPYPPPPPPAVQYYVPFRPVAHPWPPGPYFEHRW
ncbi:protein SRC2-like [Abrus precatorius]|uniref:Protein SRC2-like n=1 Tax=Abrus precatorius TaxID=3816 RepID=A0A8B8L4C7_ABRPR|nr:protein SRC2-like [Abrus precatorius]